MTSLCSSCDAPLDPGDRFCRRCGTRTRFVEAPAAERRLLTVLFCDLVGSTQLSTELDPEEMREIIQLYEGACAREVERHGGYVAQYLGDGILAYFGYPEAHERAPERAVLAALAMRDAIERLSDEVRPTWGVPLSVRVGVHTGMVVIGEIGTGPRKENLALGETPNIAARIQGQAGPGEVMISEETRRLVPDRFVLVDRGTPELKGVTIPLRLFLASDVREDGPSEPLGTAARIHGRDRDLATLHGASSTALDGGGQLVEVIGDAGLGKSHLVWSFVKANGPFVAELSCSELQSQTPLWPFVHLLQKRIGKSAMSEQRALLERHLVTMDLAALAPALCAVLGLAHPDLPADPAAARAATTDALHRYLLASRGIVVCEDLHWADASTVEVLASIRPKLDTAPVMLIATSRSSIPWADGKGPNLSIRVTPLDAASASALVHDHLGDTADPALVAKLVERAEGSPLFLEGLANVARDQDRPGELDVPASLQSLLMTRLDRVGDAKRVAQEAAVLGREFTRSQLDAITTVEAPRVTGWLERLEGADILRERISTLDTAFCFAHGLLRAVAYGSLLRNTRAQIHRRVASHLEDRLGDAAPDRATLGLIAYHLRHGLSERSAHSADVLKAVDYLLRSGSASLALSAYKEADADMEDALALVRRLPEGAERWRAELSILKNLSVIHRATIGYAAAEVEQDLRAARALCEKLGDTREVASVSLAIWSLLIARGAYLDSAKIAEETLALADRVHDEALSLRALAALGNTEFWLGRLDRAFEHSDAVIARYDPTRDSAGLTEHGWDAGVHAYMVATWSAWLLGRSDALDYERRLHALAADIDHPLTTAFAENTSCVLHALRRDAEQTIAAADRLIALADQYGFPFYRMFGGLFRTEGLVRRGDADDGFAAADATFTFYQTNLGGLAQTFVASMMAVAYAAKGQRARALEVVRRALAAVERCDERVFESALRHQEAALAAAEPTQGAIEICGALTDDRAALSSADPRNGWIPRNGA